MTDIEYMKSIWQKEAKIAERNRCAEIAKSILTTAAMADPSITQDPVKLGEAISEAILNQPDDD